MGADASLAGRTVDIAEAAGLALLCVVQAAGPVDGNVALAAVQASGALHGAAGADAAELEQAVEDRAVVADVVLALLAREVVHVVGRDLVQEVDVLVGVELRHLVLGGRLCALRGTLAASSDPDAPRLRT